MFTAAGKAASASSAVYVEDVFSTWLYTGNGSSQTITNGIDLAGKGGLVWLKTRDLSQNHYLTDTARGNSQQLSTNTTGAQTAIDTLTFLNNGVTIPSSFSTSPYNYVSWTFRKQAKFFDIVTYTGNGTARTIAHNLGSVPGCIIVKSLGAATQGGTDGWWDVYHRGLSTPASGEVFLNSTDGRNTSGVWNFTSPTSTEFSVSSGNNTTNITGRQYVAYLFAHDAGGFGATGTDNVISCGSFTTDGSGNASVNLGYEPQFIINKATVGGYSWEMGDSMRGLISFSTGYYSRQLKADLANTEGNYTGYVTSTGFEYRSGATNTTYIYIAIRRGPMKTPTSGTSVFSPKATQGPSSGSTTSSNPNYDAGFPVDLFLRGYKPGGISVYTQAFDRLRGINGGYLTTSSTASETGDNWAFDSQIGVYNTSAGSNSNNCAWLFRRAPGFFDVVCYTGTGANRTVTHNLGATPELMIVKKRQVSSVGWLVYSAALGATERLVLNLTDAKVASSLPWNNTAPTSTVFSLGTATEVNGNADTFVAYLFATVAGVSKVGSYTGTGALQTINCGFAAGARFVLIKRTDSTGDWWTYDSARGITSGNDPYLFLNSTAAEVTGTNYVDTASTGFQVTAAAPAGLNANGGTYIFLAIA